MNTPEQLIKIRTHKLGVLMLDARTTSRRSVEECAQAMGIPAAQYEAYEKGQRAPSLPELESLAYSLDLPLEHFWGSSTLATSGSGERKQTERLLKLRHRIVGTYLRLGRTRANLSYRELSQVTSISEADLKAYELGDQPIPLPQLEVMARALEMRIEEFFDQSGPIGKWRSDLLAMNKFLELPAELQQFVCKPVNRPYIDLAMRLSELQVEKLRSIAEGLLEITY